MVVTAALSHPEVFYFMRPLGLNSSYQKSLAIRSFTLGQYFKEICKISQNKAKYRLQLIYLLMFDGGDLLLVSATGQILSRTGSCNVQRI
jgi:hypothetical protein